jgi:MgtE-like protein
MTTAPSAPAPHAAEVRTLHLSELIKRPVTARDAEPLGRISDVVVRLRGSELPLVIGGVASVGARQVFVPLEQVGSFDGDVLQLSSARLDLRQFEPLIGHSASAVLRGPFARIRRLKPAQIADLLEEASKAEETEILGQVHADPELEADVFEELDGGRATRLLGARTDSEIAQVLSRMRADDAADAVAELPQHRPQAVLDLMPAGQRAPRC